VVLSAGTVAAVTWGAPTLPKAQFVSQADAICSTANAPLAAMTLPTTYEQLATAIGTLVGVIDGEVSQLGRLGRPEGPDGKVAGGVIAGLRSTSKAGKAVQSTVAAKNDAGTALTTTTFAGQFNATAAQARTLGLSACAVGLQPGVDRVYGGARGILRERFVKLAEPACSAVEKALGDVGEPESRAQFTNLIDRIITTWEKFQADLSVLPVPPGDEQAVKDLLASLSAAAVKMHEARAAVNRYDAAGFSAAWDEVGSLLDAADQKVTAYGLGDCGDPGSS
jgi:hypothetical protein